MHYTLMHKQIAVADIEIDDVTNGISKIHAVFVPEHLPVGINASAASLNGWWSGRAIPATRSGLRDALESLQITSTEALLVRCFGLSLSDQYWVNPQDKPLEWAKINFFDNSFSEDVGNALFGQPSGQQIDLMSPDNTSDGWLKKKWIIADGKRMLVKGGSAPYYQEPLNEVLASVVMQRLGIPHVDYTLQWQDGQPFSVCADFITPDTELVSAWHIAQTERKPNHVSEYQHFTNCCSALGITEVQASLDRMLVVDYLICNSDRHFNNFGAVRNAETLEWIGMAPIYDCGTSLWHDQIESRIQARGKNESKPFRKEHTEQIKLVQSLDWLDMGALQGVDTEYDSILAQSSFIDEKRREALCRALGQRVEMLRDIQPHLTAQQTPTAPIIEQTL